MAKAIRVLCLNAGSSTLKYAAYRLSGNNEQLIFDGLEDGTGNPDLWAAILEKCDPDDNFASIVAAVEEGRGVFRNLVKFITWTLPTNVAEALVILTAVGLGTVLPVLPVQILWINMSTSILLGMMLAFEPKDRDIMRRPPRDPKTPILTKELLIRIGFVGIMLLLGIYSVFIFEIRSGMDEASAQTLAANILVFGEIFYLFTCRSLRQSMFHVGLFSNKWLLVGVGTMTMLQLAFTYLPPVQLLFHTQEFPAVNWLWVICIGLLIYGLVEIEKTIRRRSLG